MRAYLYGFTTAFLLTVLAFSVILTKDFVPVSLFNSGSFYYNGKLYKCVSK